MQIYTYTLSTLFQMDVPYARRILMMMKENRLLLHCVSLSLVFLQRKKRRTAKKKSGSRKKNRQRCVAGQTRCCMQRKRERERNAMRERKNRTSSPSPTNTRTTTNGKASNSRPFDCNAFFFSRSLHPCGVLSLLLSFSRALACPSLRLRPFAALGSRSVSLSFRTHAYTRTRSVCKDIAK